MSKIYKYDDAVLNDIFKIRSVKRSILPKRTTDKINIFTRAGYIYNGGKYESLEIEIDFYLKRDTEEEYEEALRTISELFDVEELKEFSIDDKFCYAITEDAIDADPINNISCYGKISLIAYEPYFYKEEAVHIEGTTELVAENQGNTNTPAIVKVNMSNEAHFVQVENTTTGEKILIGNYPTIGNEVIKEKTIEIDDNCENTTGWNVGGANIDSDRGNTGGVLSITDKGEGIMCGDFGTSTTMWKGVCANRNLSTGLTDFEIIAHFRHNSTGKNGDPTKITYKNDTENGTSTTKKYFYKVKKSTVTVRSSASTKAKSLGTLKKGYKIKTYELANGWLKFDYKFKKGYIKTSSLQRYTETSKVTVNEMNFVTKSNTAIRTTASTKSKNKKTIPAGTVIRCNTTKYGDNKFYKLAKKYKGYTGYVYISNLIQASDVVFEYPDIEDEEKADDKTGMIELYLFDSNNSKIGKIGLYDDDPYYEFTYPLVQVGSTDFLKDKTVAPNPKVATEVKESNGKLTVTKENQLSGKYGDYNDFFGKIILKRQRKIVKIATMPTIQYAWSAEVYKIVDGKVYKTKKEKELSSFDYPDADLASIALYIGTTGTQEKASAMSLTNLVVKNLKPKTTEANKNVKIFEAGDTLKIDCCNNEIR
ncbi:distal tail protein Dit [Terrisporobacter sp.]|nr:distal tail protein Dit [Terrisporobacter sp.]